MQGLLLINKPAGMTSFAAVARVRRLTHEKRVGHTGTLDPMATGVLPVLVGRATALSAYLSDADKGYRATVQLGLTTDTLDTTGRVLTEQSVSVSREALLSVIEKFCGPIAQVPPMYSAIKRNGVPLYQLARRGTTVDLAPRNVVIRSLELTEYDEASGRFCLDVACSKGTYIRSLCRDIGQALGCGAVMAGLCRTFAGGFALEDCLALDELTEETVGERLLPCERAVDYLPALQVTEKQGTRFGNGGGLSVERLCLPECEDGALFRIKDGRRFWGVGRYDRESLEVKVACLVSVSENG